MPVFWCSRPRTSLDTCGSWSGAYPAPFLWPWPASYTSIPPTPHPSTDVALPPDRPPSRPDMVTLNVQMSLRPKLRALDVLVREYSYPLTLHVQESRPPIIQTVHPLYHTIQASAKVAKGCATILYRAHDLPVTSHSAHPTWRALVTHFAVAGVTHGHSNVYFPAEGDLDTLQEILDLVYPYLLLRPARVVVPPGDLNANCRWVPHLPAPPAPLCDLGPLEQRESNRGPATLASKVLPLRHAALHLFKDA